MKFIKKIIISGLCLLLAIVVLVYTIHLRSEIKKKNEGLLEIEVSSNNIVNIINCEIELLDEVSVSDIEACGQVTSEKIISDLDYEFLLNLYSDFVTKAEELETKIDDLNKNKSVLSIFEKDEEIRIIEADLVTLSDIKIDLETTTNFIKSE